MENENIHRVQYGEKEIILIATAHVSKKSVEEVKSVIETEKPDSVCVELCENRYETIKDKDKWKNTDIFQVIKSGKSLLFLVNILLASYQKKMANKFGIEPGGEMIQGIKSADEIGANLVLADRDIQTTFSRIWGNIGLWGKIKLMFQAVMSAFGDEDISEEDLQELKSEDMLTTVLNELSTSFPDLTTPLVHERDLYLAHKIKEAKGNKIVAVLGAAHVPGIKKELFNDTETDIDELCIKPKKKKWGKFVGWGISIGIISLIAYTLFTNRSDGLESILSWVIWNGSLSAIAGAIAFAHPLAILTAFAVAPISSLNPLLAAGWFAGIVEAYKRKPNVSDFESLSNDVGSIKGIWKNKVSRILLVVIFVNLGSTVGTLIGGAEVIKLFLQNIL